MSLIEAHRLLYHSASGRTMAPTASCFGAFITLTLPLPRTSHGYDTHRKIRDPLCLSSGRPTYYSQASSWVIQESMSLKYEPASVPQHISDNGSNRKGRPTAKSKADRQQDSKDGIKGRLVCDDAGLVINKFSLRGVRCPSRRRTARRMRPVARG